jgi:DNA-directed RNA polymerase subunit RPC12/RpoP
MIRVACPTCGARYKTEDEFAGRMANCPNCGAALTVPGKVASAASAPGAKPTTPLIIPARGVDGFAIAGLVCGILACVIPFFPFVAVFSFAPAIVGLACSVTALVKAVKANTSRRLAITGLVLSAAALVWAPLFIFVLRGTAAGTADARPW